MLNVVLFADIKPPVLLDMFRNHDPFRRQTALNTPSIATIFIAAMYQSQSNLIVHQTFGAADRLSGFPLSDFFLQLQYRISELQFFFTSVRFLINTTVSVKRDLWVVVTNFPLECCYVNYFFFQQKLTKDFFFLLFPPCLNYLLSVRKSRVLY